MLLLLTRSTRNHKKETRLSKDAKWICDLYMCDMVKPSFIPPADIRHLRDLVRYRFKLTCMITGEKNRAQNCLTVSNLKLDDVFSDVLGKSSRSITEHILQHPGESFDVTPFVDGRCKTPIAEIQAAVDGAVSPEQAINLRQCLDHIDELEKHLEEIAQEIFRLSDKYQDALDLIRTVPGFDKNPMTAIQILSEIGGDMSVFPTAKHLVSRAGCCPRNDQSNQKIKSTRISRAGTYSVNESKVLTTSQALDLLRQRGYISAFLGSNAEELLFPPHTPEKSLVYSGLSRIIGTKQMNFSVA